MRHVHYAWDAMGQGYPAGSYELTTLPGCPAVCVSHALILNDGVRGKGMGKGFAKDRVIEASELGYDAMVCTVDMSNIAQLKCLEHAGWKLATTFKSRRNGHQIGIYTNIMEI